jgi:hypothetical protein
MASRNATGPRTLVPAPAAPAAKPRSEENPLDVIHDRLNQALGTLDLLFTMLSVRDCAQEHLEGLRVDTLINATHGVMLRIDEALAAAGQAARPQAS